MNINIQVSGQDMSASSGAFPRGAPPAAAPESAADEMATATGSKKPKAKSTKAKSTKAKSTKTKAPAKKGGKSKFTLEGSPVSSDSRFEWSIIAFLLVAILLVL
jgi:hypothetical protein